MTTTQEYASGSNRAEADEPLLRAKFAIDPHPESGCAVAFGDRDIREVTQNFKVDVAGCSGDSSWDCLPDCAECHTELTFDGGSDEASVYHKTSVSEWCLCPIFERRDCIAHIEAVESETLIVVLTVPSREELQRIVDDLKVSAATFTIEWLVHRNDDQTVAEVDVSSITDKQREALELALDIGYYETPRKSNLSHVAEKLGISESATSQRLNAAETKLVRSFLDG